MESSKYRQTGNPENGRQNPKREQPVSTLRQILTKRQDKQPELIDKLGLTQQGIGRLNDHASRQAIKRVSQAKTGSR